MNYAPLMPLEPVLTPAIEKWITLTTELDGLRQSISWNNSDRKTWEQMAAYYQGEIDDANEQARRAARRAEIYAELLTLGKSVWLDASHYQTAHWNYRYELANLVGLPESNWKSKINDQKNNLAAEIKKLESDLRRTNTKQANGKMTAEIADELRAKLSGLIEKKKERLAELEKIKTYAYGRNEKTDFVPTPQEQAHIDYFTALLNAEPKRGDVFVSPYRKTDDKAEQAA